MLVALVLTGSLFLPALLASPTSLIVGARATPEGIRVRSANKDVPFVAKPVPLQESLQLVIARKPSGADAFVSAWKEERLQLTRLHVWCIEGGRPRTILFATTPFDSSVLSAETNQCEDATTSVIDILRKIPRPPGDTTWVETVFVGDISDTQDSSVCAAATDGHVVLHVLRADHTGLHCLGLEIRLTNSLPEFLDTLRLQFYRLDVDCGSAETVVMEGSRVLGAVPCPSVVGTAPAAPVSREGTSRGPDGRRTESVSVFAGQFAAKQYTALITAAERASGPLTPADTLLVAESYRRVGQISRSRDTLVAATAKAFREAQFNLVLWEDLYGSAAAEGYEALISDPRFTARADHLKARATLVAQRDGRRSSSPDNVTAVRVPGGLDALTKLLNLHERHEPNMFLRICGKIVDSPLQRRLRYSYTLRRYFELLDRIATFAAVEDRALSLTLGRHEGEHARRELEKIMSSEVPIWADDANEAHSVPLRRIVPVRETLDRGVITLTIPIEVIDVPFGGVTYPTTKGGFYPAALRSVVELPGLAGKWLLLLSVQPEAARILNGILGSRTKDRNIGAHNAKAFRLSPDGATILPGGRPEWWQRLTDADPRDPNSFWQALLDKPNVLAFLAMLMSLDTPRQRLATASEERVTLLFNAFSREQGETAQSFVESLLRQVPVDSDGGLALPGSLSLWASLLGKPLPTRGPAIVTPDRFLELLLTARPVRDRVLGAMQQLAHVQAHHAGAFDDITVGKLAALHWRHPRLLPYLTYWPYLGYEEYAFILLAADRLSTEGCTSLLGPHAMEDVLRLLALSTGMGMLREEQVTSIFLGSFAAMAERRGGCDISRGLLLLLDATAAGSAGSGGGISIHLAELLIGPSPKGSPEAKELAAEYLRAVPSLTRWQLDGLIKGALQQSGGAYPSLMAALGGAQQGPAAKPATATGRALGQEVISLLRALLEGLKRFDVPASHKDLGCDTEDTPCNLMQVDWLTGTLHDLRVWSIPLLTKLGREWFVTHALTPKPQADSIKLLDTVDPGGRWMYWTRAGLPPTSGDAGPIAVGADEVFLRIGALLVQSQQLDRSLTSPVLDELMRVRMFNDTEAGVAHSLLCQHVPPSHLATTVQRIQSCTRLDQQHLRCLLTPKH